jgi:hypothetical protein
MVVNGHLHASAALPSGEETTLPIGCEAAWAQEPRLDAAAKRNNPITAPAGS